ncbi:Siderophore biosynthesis non-ribosomal peptide synthetase modules [[Actinomadura] parvosata subsp. kistnae]|nr:Siderophore biosynthesis non-ribosomal peptide synthetase modules [Actinomadura parvosata subsp. kistnae]
MAESAMLEPSPRLVSLSSARLAGLRRRTGDHPDRALVEACAIGLAYWAAGSSPDGLDLAPGTLFTDVIGWAGAGGRAPTGWEVAGRGITVPEGVDLADAQLALDDLADFPDRPVGTIGPSSVEQRLRTLAEWNDTGAERDRPTIVRMFLDQARARPDAVAIVDERRSLTYREAATLAAQLAHHLMDRGLTAEQTVGISLERSADMVIGLLGVLMAGCAFVPLDPAWPAARRAVVIADAGLATQLNRSGERAEGEPEAVAVDLGDWRFGSYPAEAPELDIPGPALAYVIFTSGSTGRPKGAMIRHEAISERLLWQAGEILGFGPDDASLFKAPLSFDISINEIFLPLVRGGRLVVLRPGGERDPHHLLSVIAGQRVTFTYLVSSMLDVLLEMAGDSGRLGSLRHVWCGGEVLTPELYERFRTRLGIPLYHGYGPAETTIGVSHVIYRGAAERLSTSIGRANPNTQLYVLDEELRPVPAGVGGELYVGGFLLGRGYVGAPGLTASRFVANPFASDGSRLYRTGDLARFAPDGSLDFLGRADNQIKIRGMRLELEDVEAGLAEHPGVRHACVVAKKNTAGGTYLVGYVIPAAGSEDLRPSDVTAWAAGNMVDYMVPAHVVVMKEFPLTENGKLDRRALPEPVAEAGPLVAPATENERVVCAAVAAVLGLDEVGVDQSFFTLGGDSLLAISLLSALREAGLRFTATDIFTAPTVGALAAAARRDEGAVADLEDVATGPVTGSPIVRWLGETTDAIDGFVQSVVLNTPAGLTPEALDRLLGALLDRHDMLRARLVRGDRWASTSRPLAGWRSSGASTSRPRRGGRPVGGERPAGRRVRLARRLRPGPGRGRDARGGLAARGPAARARRPPRGDRRRLVADPDGRPGHRLAAARLGRADRAAAGRHVVPALDAAARTHAVRAGPRPLPAPPAGAGPAARPAPPDRGRHRRPRAVAGRHGRARGDRRAAGRAARALPRRRQRRAADRARRRPRPAAPRPGAGSDVRTRRAGGARPRGPVRGGGGRVRAGAVADRRVVHHVVPRDRGPGRGRRPHLARVPGRCAQGRQGGPCPGAGQRPVLRRAAAPGRRRVRRARAAGAVQLPGPLRRGRLRGLAARRRHHRAARRAARPRDAAAARPGVQRDRRAGPDRRVRAGHHHLLAGRRVHRRRRDDDRDVLPGGPVGAGLARRRRPLPQRLPPAVPHPGRRGRARRPGAARRPAADPVAGGPVLPLRLRRRLGRQLRRAAAAHAGGRGGRRSARGGGHPPAHAVPEPGRAVRGAGRRPRGVGAGERRDGAVPHDRAGRRRGRRLRRAGPPRRVRPGDRAADALHAHPYPLRRARPGADRAPHHRRRLVGAGDAVRAARRVPRARQRVPARRLPRLRPLAGRAGRRRERPGVARAARRAARPRPGRRGAHAVRPVRRHRRAAGRRPRRGRQGGGRAAQRRRAQRVGGDARRAAAALRRRLRLHRVRPRRAGARHRRHGGPVHQHDPRPRAVGRRHHVPRAARLRAGAPERGAAAPARLAGQDRPAGRERAAVRHARGLRRGHRRGQSAPARPLPRHHPGRERGRAALPADPGGGAGGGRRGALQPDPRRRAAAGEGCPGDPGHVHPHLDRAPDPAGCPRARPDLRRRAAGRPCDSG